MPYRLIAEDIGIGQLFSGHYQFEIPEFQREYVWRVEQAEELLDDIISAMLDAERAGRVYPYFLGTMLFARRNEAHSTQSVAIVDGQQRIITLTILIAALRDLALTSERDELARCIVAYSETAASQTDAFHLSPRSLDAHFFERAIQRDGATRRPRREKLLTPRNRTQVNVEANRKYFVDHIRRALDTKTRTDLARYLLAQCRVLAIEAGSLDYAYQIFLTINRRGIQLTDEDVVLAEVVGPLGSDQQSRFAMILAQMERYRDHAETARYREKTFFSHLARLHGWSGQTMIGELRRAVARSGGPQRFARDVFQPLAEAYLLTRCDFSSGTPPETVEEHLRGLWLLERYGDDEWVSAAMLGLGRLSVTSGDPAAFLAKLDRFAYVQVLVNPGRKARRQRYKRILDILRDDATDLAGLDFAQLFELTQGEQERALKQAARRLKTANNRLCKAVLIRLDAHVSGRPLAYYMARLAECDSRNDPLTIEHLLPEGATLPDESGWRAEFDDDQHRIAVANMMGNLALIEDSHNNAAKQHDFDQKKDLFFSSAAEHPLLLTEELRAATHWGHAEIKARHTRMMDAFSALWGLAGKYPQVLVPATAPAAGNASAPLSEAGSENATTLGAPVEPTGAATTPMMPAALVTEETAPEPPGLHADEDVATGHERRFSRWPRIFRRR